MKNKGAELARVKISAGSGMAERPIIMSTEMVRAILEGRKTMTRRVIKPQPVCTGTSNIDRFEYHDSFGGWIPTSQSGKIGIFKPASYKCPYGKPGDLLWVKETWVESFTACLTDPKQSHRSVIYRADGREYYNFSNEKIKWKSPIFMPKKYARIWLEIIDIRIERLKSLSPEDGIAEGVEHWSIFPSLWDSLNGKKYPWSSNPWVWCISFRREK